MWRNEPNKALELFPKGEKDSFITTMEKTYLKLLQGEVDIDRLKYYEKYFESRIRFRVSREVKDFFYADTPEGYYASEHEIIWVHFLLSWAYAIEGDFEEGKRQARKASYYLGGEWSYQGRFDDPLMRILLGVFYAMNQAWDEARVEFRSAYAMEPSRKWLANLSNTKSPPKELILIMGFPGREPRWDPKMNWNVVRGMRDLKFQSFGQQSRLRIKDKKYQSINLHISPDSSAWYVRHLERDNFINDLIQDSKYGQRVALGLTKSTVISTAGLTGGILIGVAGIAIGGGIMYVGFEGNSGEIAALGGLLAYTMVKAGYDFTSNSFNIAKEDFVNTVDIAKNYRYVRFLPDYVWIGSSSKSLLEPLTLYDQSGQITKQWMNTEKRKNRNTRVLIYSDLDPMWDIVN
ncbi:MAG: hypothetical protein JJT78_02035 [Leptospira sp.]|nr:hypothetical protein [Leptospira sp.]